MNRTITIQHYESPCGKLLLGSCDDKLCLCNWQGKRHRQIVDERIRNGLQASFEEGVSDVTANAAVQLDEYFGGKRTVFDMPLLFVGTDFQQSVWQLLPEIPYGQTLSYAALSLRLGRPEAVRAVANANGANALSIFVPCHRVIGSNDRLTGYGGGLAAKMFLIKLEYLVTQMDSL
ncbi:MAG: methylated-DNA--[protein]-cysteine S-methyltransferase [Tannerella sp.]|nr:methylated-DNA--[protein]-cysteine S-methyltransferase [Tannerella sp.]